jgi:hypothetical protein
VDPAGHAFKEDTQLENLSVGGLFLRLSRYIPEGSSVLVSVRLSSIPAQQAPALRLVARSTVLRSALQADGTWGIAVEFRRRRIL